MTTSKQCEKCSASATDTARYCTKCGHKLGDPCDPMLALKEPQFECYRCDGPIFENFETCPNCREVYRSGGEKLVSRDTLKALMNAGRYITCPECQCQLEVTAFFGNCSVCSHQIPQGREGFEQLLVPSDEVRRPAVVLDENHLCKTCQADLHITDLIDASYETEMRMGGGPQTDRSYYPDWVVEATLLVENPSPKIRSHCSSAYYRNKKKQNPPPYTRASGPTLSVEDATRIECAIDIFQKLKQFFESGLLEPLGWDERVRKIFFRPCECCGDIDPMGMAMTTKPAGQFLELHPNELS